MLIFFALCHRYSTITCKFWPTRLNNAINFAHGSFRQTYIMQSIYSKSLNLLDDVALILIRLIIKEKKNTH